MSKDIYGTYDISVNNKYKIELNNKTIERIKNSLMKLNISLNGFKKNHKNNKDQILYFSKRCTNYSIIENLFRFILAEKNSFIFESVEKGKIKGRYTIIGLNPDKIWDINKNIVTVSFNGIKKK